MKNTLKSLILGGLVAGGLLASTTLAFARDYWHWSREHNRWDRRADLRSDEARIRDIDHEINADRSELR